MGIVTWATVRTELLPSIEDPHVLGADTLEGLIPYVYDVQRAMLGEQSFIVNAQCAAMLMAGTDEARFDSLRPSLPPFVCLQNIAGFERLPEERLDYQRGDITRHAARHGLSLQHGVGGLDATDLLARSNDASHELAWQNERTGACLSVFFLTTLDRTPSFIELFTTCAREHGIHAADIGVYLQPIVQNHGCHLELLVPYDPASREAAQRAMRVERDAVGRLLDAGAYFSRPYGSADRIFEKNPGNLALVRQVKSLFDPNRVLQRGKWGL
jgi:FAD/FMN-containing dehydrogenase